VSLSPLAASAAAIHAGQPDNLTFACSRGLCLPCALGPAHLFQQTRPRSAAAQPTVPAHLPTLARVLCSGAARRLLVRHV
jgi:hypothetical protein